MRLEAFRIQNYKRIADTDWVAVQGLTVLVGKNEAGKSAVLRGLSKINPSDGEGYDGLREYPRSRFSDEFSEHDPAASVRFELDDEDRKWLGAISPLLSTVTSVEVTRLYNNKHTIRFSPDPFDDYLSADRVREVAQGALDAVTESLAPDGHGDEFRPVKQAMMTELSAQIDSLQQGGVATATVEAIANVVASRIAEQWQSTVLAPIAQPLRALAKESRDRGALANARKWVIEHLPQFIYFDRYDVLDSAIHTPTFLGQVGADPHAPRVRTTQCLFGHVDLDPNVLHQLAADLNISQEEMRRRVDERAIRTSSAGQAMTERFSAWWLQRRHKFRYDLDGDYFRVWVSDDLDPSDIELDQRSQGMQYFFSFFLVFLVEAQGEHSNSILLLDEPGTSLHGTAQAKIIEFLRSISLENQVIYTTHSPFMIDGDHLEEVRPVWEDPTSGSTKVSDNVWPKDKDALFPLQAALGYQLAQSLFISRHQVLVEGITDYWILKALAMALAETGHDTFNPDVIFTPGGGAGRLVPLASMLVGHEVHVAALLDGDESGRKEAKKLQRLLGTDTRTIFVGDNTHDGNFTGEIEDLFPDDYYLSAVIDAVRVGPSDGVLRDPTLEFCPPVGYESESIELTTILAGWSVVGK